MSTLKFHDSFADLWKWALAYSAILGSMVYLFAFAAGAHLPFGMTYCVALIVGTTLCLIASGCPVYVTAETIRCYNFWGVYRTLRWEDIAYVRKFNIFGLRYVSLRDAPGRHEITVPFYLDDMPGFARVVRACAGNDHPLTHALSGYLPSEGAMSGESCALSTFENPNVIESPCPTPSIPTAPAG